MELLQLQYFRTLARLEHMTKAAEELHVSQPSLSKTISRLEEDLGHPLFERRGRHLRLNEYGRVLLDRADRALAELEEAKREMDTLAGAPSNTVALAVSIPRVLPDLIGSFLARCPGVRFRQLYETTASMKKLLQEGDIDFCISSVPIEGRDLVWKPLMTEEIYLLVHTGHPLSQRDSIRLEEASEEAFISLNTGMGFRDLTDGFCRQAGFLPSVAFEGDDPETIGELVRQGLGVSFLPALSSVPSRDPSLRRVRISDPPCRRTIGMGWSVRRHLTPAALSFKAFASEYLASRSSDSV